jgi:hypothetical protein
VDYEDFCEYCRDMYGAIEMFDEITGSKEEESPTDFDDNIEKAIDKVQF